MISPARESRAAPEQSDIDKRLDSILQSVQSGDLDAATAAVTSLRKVLKPCDGRQQREDKRGGVQYRPLYILDSVLLADNLRMIHAQEPDLLEIVVKQSFVCREFQIEFNLGMLQLQCRQLRQPFQLELDGLTLTVVL